LVGGIVTIGEEGDGGGVGRPDEIGGVAGLAGRCGGDGLALDEIVEIAKTVQRGDTNLASFNPGKALGIGRNGDLSEGAGAILAGENFVELCRRWNDCGLGGGGGLSVIEGSRAESDKNGSAMEAA
jgi:hypothetical protein